MSAAIAAERRISYRKAAGSCFYYRTANESLCPWEKHLTLISEQTKQSICRGHLAVQKTCKLAGIEAKKGCFGLLWFTRHRMPVSCEQINELFVWLKNRLFAT